MSPISPSGVSSLSYFRDVSDTLLFLREHLDLSIRCKISPISP